MRPGINTTGKGHESTFRPAEKLDDSWPPAALALARVLRSDTITPRPPSVVSASGLAARPRP